MLSSFGRAPGAGLPRASLLQLFALVSGVVGSRAIAQGQPFECEIIESATSATRDGNPWPGGVVPITSPGLSFTHAAIFASAIQQIESVCSVRFVGRTNETDYVVIQNGTGNNSPVGRIGGAQVININTWQTFVVVHEMCHTLGFLHEQCRPDRDRYVQINIANIAPGREHNFYRFDSSQPYGPYDFDSVMHYPTAAFSSNGGPTITVLPPRTCWQASIGQSTHLSYWDIQGLRARYGPAPQPITDLELGVNVTSQELGWPFATGFRWLAADANGDGKSDVIQVDNTGTGANARIRVAFSNGVGGYTTTTHDTISLPYSASWAWLAGDHDGNRTSDVVMVSNTGPGGAARIHTLLSRGNGTFAPGSQQDTSWSAAGPWLLGDVNGDGRADVINAANTGPGGTIQIRTALSNGAGGYTLATHNTGWSWPASAEWFVGDANADGRADLMLADGNGSGGTALLRTAVSSGNGAYVTSRLESGWPWAAGQRWFVGDEDGDRRSDFMMVAGDGPGGSARLRVARAVGPTSFALSFFDTTWIYSNDTRWLVGDVNGDSGTDFMMVARHDSDLGGCGSHAAFQATIRNSMGRYVQLAAEPGLGFEAHHVWLPADLNADRRADYVIVSDAGAGGTVRLSAVFATVLPALAVPIGRGCWGPTLAPDLRSGRPILGQNMSYLLSSSTPSTPVLSFLSPRPLGPIGLGNCTLDLDPIVMPLWIRGVTDATGLMVMNIFLPTDPALAGVTLRNQAILPLTTELTNALDLTLGRY